MLGVLAGQVALVAGATRGAEGTAELITSGGGTAVAMTPGFFSRPDWGRHFRENLLPT